MIQIAEMIRRLLDAYDQPTPAILEIPSKDHPYDPSKDSILRRARVCIIIYHLCVQFHNGTLGACPILQLATSICPIEYHHLFSIAGYVQQ